MSKFYEYFKENMDGLGLPAPDSLFATLQTSVATALAFVNHIDKFGPRVTVRDVIGAGLRAERLGVAATMLASAYVGAVIGSIAVATGRCLGNGTSLGDVLLTAKRYGLDRSWLLPAMTAKSPIAPARARKI